MFSAEDAKELFQLLSSEGDPKSPLIFAASGDGFVTRKYTYRAFEDLVTKVYVTQKVKLSSLARDLDVNADTVRTLAEEFEGTILLRSSNGREIITKLQRDAIKQELETSVTHGVISKDAFARKHDLLQSSLDLLISMSDERIEDVDGHLYSTSYSMAASSAIASSLRHHVQLLQAIHLGPTNVPGSPPTWFIHRTIDTLLEDPEFTGKFYVRVQPEGIHCTPVQLVKQMHDTITNDLQSGKTAYIDLHVFQRDNEAIYPKLQQAQTAVGSLQGVELVGAFAISEAWISKFSTESSAAMARDGIVKLGQPVKIDFPDAVHATVLDKVEQATRALSPGARRVGDCMLSEHGYPRDRGTLLDLAKADAVVQWQQLKEDPKTDIKYSLSRIIEQVPKDRPVLQDLIKDRTVERALEDSFAAQLLQLEKQNEVEFAGFWTDRVTTRAAIYTEGLTAIEDEKLQGQLSELLAQYVQKDFVPDAIAKATLQGLLLSRKTRKNIQKLESALGTDNMDVSSLTASLDKFNKKQSIEAPSGATLEASKETMLSDMVRRMQKQKKSDGPLLFLTLVVFLFSKYNAGVVYATGKFAPKLLKQLKRVLKPEQHAQLEAWKEAAKAGTLTAQDRGDMQKMVEAQV